MPRDMHNSTNIAPIWKAYLAIRSSNSSGVCNTKTTISKSRNYRERKRPMPSTSRREAPGAMMWVTLTTPLTLRRGEDNRTMILENIRHYWDGLGVNERQQVLFLDDPELVKQLYKLNLSLLCVGLMQRHLKTSNRATKTATLPSTRICTGTASEKTYELLEAMEFMDISTGILTVKAELAESTDRLFTLVGDVLEGFLTSIHVLTESSFNKLFVTESETINTWANYQRLIAMLVEQLILRSYVSYLEKKAAQQMEQLLLEVSLEDNNLLTSSTIHGKKKSKKKKKGKSATRAGKLIDQADLVKIQSSGHRISDKKQLKTDDDPIAPVTEESMIVDAFFEPMPEPTLLPKDSNCKPDVPIKSIDEVKTLDTEVNKTEPSTKKSSLNPNALIFHPQEIVTTSEDSDVPASFVGKRKYEKYIVNVPWEDVDRDFGSAFDNQSFNGDFSPVEKQFDDKGAHQRWRKQRRREEDAKLQKQLQRIYASTASLIGWDLVRQCEVQNPDVRPVWSNSTLWKTTPKEVVRYFSHENDDEYSFPYFLPPASSRYYFNPEPSMPFVPPLLSPPTLNNLFTAVSKHQWSSHH